MVSRFFGYLRDMAMAYSFGGDHLISLLLVGFRTSNLPRRLFGEGALQSILIASYQKEVHSQEGEGPSSDSKNSLNIDTDSFDSASKKKIDQLQADCQKTWSFSLLGFIAFFMSLFSLILMLGDRYGLIQARHQLILIYTSMMLPGLWFICMSALSDAYLKTHRRFLIGSMAPVAFNIVWILSSLGLCNKPSYEAATWLCLGICLAYMMQWLVTYFGMQQELFKPRSRGRFFSPRVRKLIKPMFQGILGVGATQINGLLDSFFALYSDDAGPTYLWFAIRIEQAPLALIGLAISSASLPALSSFIEKRKAESAKQIFNFSLTRMMTYMLGACSGMMCLGFIGVRLALEHGDFDTYNTFKTTQCIWGYSLGLLGQSLLFLYQNLAFSLHCYALVTRSSLYAVIFNIIGNALCVYLLNLGPASVALTTSFATFFQLYLLRAGLQKRHNTYYFPFSWKNTFKVAFVYLLTFLATQSALCYLYSLNLASFFQGIKLPAGNPSLLSTLYIFSLLCLVWALVYLPLAYLLRLPLPYEFLPKKWRTYFETG